MLTVSARLNRSFDVANALDRDTVLVITVNKLVLKLADLVDQDAEFIRDIRHIIVTRFAPDRELLL